MQRFNNIHEEPDSRRKGDGDGGATRRVPASDGTHGNLEHGFAVYQTG
jgi:hypothetical protein